MPTFQLSSDSLETRDAAADLTGKEGYLAVLNTSSQAALAGAAGNVYGVINEGAVAGRAATLHVRGLANCIAGGTFAVGTSLTSDAGGLAVAATTGQRSFGRARTAGVAAKWVEVALDFHLAP